MTTSPLTPLDLRVEHRTAPLGIDITLPRFSWRLASDQRGSAQTAYRIVVASATAEFWDSGWVTDSENQLVEYSGTPLVGRTPYRWSVAVRDEAGRESVVAESKFETAILDAAEFAGEWISRDPRRDVEFDPPQDDDISAKVRHIPPANHLRRTITLAEGKTVARARAYATARGIYQFFVNDERIGDEELAPGWTDYRDRILYQTLDLTEVLRPGPNGVGIVLADGWWSGYVGFDSRRQGNHYGEFPEAWAQIHVDYDDGTSDRFVTDGSWTESEGAIAYTDLLMGEYVIASHDLGAFTSHDYDDSAWAPARSRDLGFAELEAAVDEPVRVHEVLPALSRTEPAPDTAIYDFGQNLVGRIRVDLGTVPAGERIQFRYGEVLDGDLLYTDNLRTAEATDVYVGDGRDDAVFAPQFTLHGFRFLEITGASAPIAPDAIVAEVLYNDTPWVGEVETSSADVNQLLSNVRWGQRGNFVAVPTDCPQRDERLGWMADAQVFLPTAALNADVSAFFTRWLRDVRFAQSEEGSFSDIAPVVSQFFADGAPAWADAGTIMPWHLYRVYGDERLLAESLPSMRAWIDFLVKHNPDLLWTRRVGNQYGDWLQIDAVTPRDVLATAYFAHSTTLTARAAEVLGDTEAAEYYGDLASRIRSAFAEAYVASDYRIEGDTQTVYLLALAFDLLPEAATPALAGHLARTVEAHDRLLTTGFVGVSLLCPVLTRVGRADLAYALLETDRYPSWLYSVRQGATTIWERWDGWTEHAGFQSVEMNSFNHYSLGAVAAWIYNDVAGIDQTDDSVGYSTLRIAPVPGGSLTWARGSFQSPRGTVTTEWSTQGDVFSLAVSVPPGSDAVVRLPRSGAVREGTVAIADVPEVTLIASDSTGTTVRVPSGRYHFTVGN